MNEIDVAHSVALDPLLAEKFSALGVAGLLNVIEDHADHKTILEHLNFFRRLWVEGMPESTRKGYLNRHVGQHRK